MNSTSSDLVDVTMKRCKDIATAIYLDDEENLKRFITNGKRSTVLTM